MEDGGGDEMQGGKRRRHCEGGGDDARAAAAAAAAASFTSSLGADDDDDSLSTKLTETISDILKQTQTAMENLLPVIHEINGRALNIKKKINEKREMATEKRAQLEQAATSVLQVLTAASEDA